MLALSWLPLLHWLVSAWWATRNKNKDLYKPTAGKTFPVPTLQPSQENIKEAAVIPAESAMEQGRGFKTVSGIQRQLWSIHR